MQLFNVIFAGHLFLPLVDVVFECTAGRWGLHCTKTCGFCEGGAEFCQVYDGYCMNGCAGGYKGKHCKDLCELGTYGQYCQLKCGSCSSIRPDCDPHTGKCLAGCQPGYQSPYCHTPCEFGMWGEECQQDCECGNITDNWCGCNPVTGECQRCVGNGGYYPVSLPVCLNEHIMTGDIHEYVPDSVFNFPYKPILAVASSVALFVCGNFMWWWFMVRNPEPKPLPVVVRRDKLVPRYRRPEIKYKSTMQQILSTKVMRRKSSARKRKYVAKSSVTDTKSTVASSHLSQRLNLPRLASLQASIHL